VKLYAVKRPDGTVVQDHYALSGMKSWTALRFISDTKEGGEIDGSDAILRRTSAGPFIRRHGYSVVEVEIVEKKK